MKATVAILALLLAACGGGGGSGDQSLPVHYVVADFQAVEDFLENPYVQEMLARGAIQVHNGSTPPLLEGEYEVHETVFIDDLPGNLTGPVAPYNMVMYDQSGDRITVDDGSVVEPLLTGSGTGFTLWFVVSSDVDGCAIVEVDVLSGTVLPNGDLDIRFGAVIVGASGAGCGAIAGLVSGGSVDAMRGIAVVSEGDALFLGPP